MRRDITAALVEFVGTALLVCTVVGSGMMGTSLSDNLGVALLINAASTVLVLALLIVLLGPVSGAHLNPVVSLAELLWKKLTGVRFALYLIAQMAGGLAGAALANLMFAHPALEVATTQRANAGNLLGEVVATAGLVAAIFNLTGRDEARLVPVAVAAWIGSAYFFTSSTSFANPAVTFGRMFTDSFAGIAPESFAPFVGTQLVGMLLGLAAARGLHAAERLHSPSTLK